MPPHGEVSLAFHQQKLPIRRRQPARWIAHPLRRIGACQLRKHQRHHCPLPEALHNLPRRVTQQGRSIFLRLMQRPPQVARLMHRVRIGKQQPRPARPLRPRPARIRLSGKPAPIALVQLGSLDYHHSLAPSRGCPRNLPCPIRRIVIDDDQLPLHPQRKPHLRLRHQRPQALPQHRRLVARRHHHRQPQPRLRGRRNHPALPRPFARIAHRFVL